jgi:hypothetical protein
MSSSSPSTLLSKSLRSAPSNPTGSSSSIPVSRGGPSSSSPNALSTPSRPTRARAQAVLATAAASPEAEAGPSTRHALNSPAQDGIGREESASDGSPAKGKGKAPAKPEKRVLPARIRRAAGGGAEGIRDLEEMIVDWLERWGECTRLVPTTHFTRVYSSCSLHPHLRLPIDTAVDTAVRHCCLTPLSNTAV